MRISLAVLLLLSACAISQEPNPPRVLPGAEPGGSIRLPDSWSIKPAGKQVELGDFPVNIALHPSGEWLAVLHAGYGAHETITLDVAGKQDKVRSRVVVD